MKNYSNYILIILSVVVLTGCASSPRFLTRDDRYETENSTAKDENGKQITTKEETEKEGEDVITSTELYEKFKNAEPLETVTGTASFYADKFHGKVTYNGEVYNMNGISAAHQTYAMGTVIRVTNISNGKNIILIINDRMPFREDRIIDLSLGAAKKLGIIQAGLMEVKVEVLEWGTGKK